MEEIKDKPSGQRLQAYLDQVILRIFNSSPGLASYIESYRTVDSSGAVEISFYKKNFPDEIILGVNQAFAIAGVEVLKYTKNGQSCIGFRCHPTKEDLSGLAVDDGDEVSDELHTDPDGLKDQNVSVEKEANDMLKSPGQPSAT